MSSIIAKTSSSNSFGEHSNELINDIGHIVTPAEPFPKRHKFIRNGTFKSVLNGNSFTPATTGLISSKYVLDGWFLKQNGGCVVNVARGTSAYKEINSMYYAVINILSTSGTDNYVIFEQREHDITKYAGRVLSLSFMAKCSTSAKIAIEFKSDYNNSQKNGSESVNIDLTTEWTRYDVRVAIPPIPGDSVGSLSKLVTRFWLSSNGYEGFIGDINDGPAYFYFSDIDDGSKSSEPSIYDEQDDVARYFEKVSGSTIPVPNAGKTAASSDVFGRVYFLTKKAVFPTAAQITIDGSANITSPSVGTPSRQGFNVIGVASSSSSASTITGYTCNCELGE
ncbi:hypothetical protein [Escherichia coli]|uniref:hypothetical protein n=1 Tax=Escherichia coli TaxID=562 RepID=UPI000937A60C|nr:hypothetical protein [Escherichia coli]OKA58234.1 hypothetical protein BHL56_26155 [Escherichia coli]OKA58486.1 hypothetical protein BHL56_01000 [Escherichia coli]